MEDSIDVVPFCSRSKKDTAGPILSSDFLFVNGEEFRNFNPQSAMRNPEVQEF